MDKALKQRLVGASVLVALAVVVLPMLLGGQPESPPEARQIEIPPKPRETSFETRRFPIGEQPADTPSVVPPAGEAPPVSLPAPRIEPATEGEPESALAAEAATDNAAAAPVEAGDPEPVTPPDEADATSPEPGAATASTGDPDAGDGAEPLLVEAEPTPSEAAPAPTPAPATPADPDGRYLVQVASFSATGNATRLASRLREQGLPVIEDTVDSEAGTLHRVRLGPFDDRARADQAMATLRRQYSDLRPRLLDLRPDEESPVTEPSDPLVRWVVQLGSFGEPDNAEQLVFRLRDAGYSAFSVAVSGSPGTVHKVRVGPVVSRDEAVRIESQIESSMGLDGLVMSTD